MNHLGECNVPREIILEIKPERSKRAVFQPVTQHSLKVMNYTTNYIVRCSVRIHSLHFEIQSPCMSQDKSKNTTAENVNEAKLPTIKHKNEDSDGMHYHILSNHSLSSNKYGCYVQIWFNDTNAIPIGRTPFVRMKSTNAIKSNPSGYPWYENMIVRMKKRERDSETKHHSAQQPARKRQKKA